MEYIKSYFQLYDFVSGRTIFQKRCFLTEDVSMEALKTNVLSVDVDGKTERERNDIPAVGPCLCSREGRTARLLGLVSRL